MKKLIVFLTGDVADANLGLWLLRVFTGVAMMTHGIPKLLGGPAVWRGVGGVMARIGVPGPAVFWGFMAAVSESLAALSLALGLFTRASAALMAVTMAVAAFVFHARDPFRERELALMFLFVSLLYVFKGPGRVSIDRLIKGKG